eukprot:364109-Chlamydomonas_euryale.AAC.3
MDREQPHEQERVAGSREEEAEGGASGWGSRGDDEQEGKNKHQGGKGREGKRPDGEQTSRRKREGGQETGRKEEEGPRQKPKTGRKKERKKNKKGGRTSSSAWVYRPANDLCCLLRYLANLGASWCVLCHLPTIRSVLPRSTQDECGTCARHAAGRAIVTGRDRRRVQAGGSAGRLGRGEAVACRRAGAPARPVV